MSVEWCLRSSLMCTAPAAVELWSMLAAEAEPSNPKRGLFTFRGQSLRMPERGHDGRVSIASCPRILAVAIRFFFPPSSFTTGAAIQQAYCTPHTREPHNTCVITRKNGAQVYVRSEDGSKVHFCGHLVGPLEGADARLRQGLNSKLQQRRKQQPPQNSAGALQPGVPPVQVPAAAATHSAGAVAGSQGVAGAAEAGGGMMTPRGQPPAQAPGSVLFLCLFSWSDSLVCSLPVFQSIRLEHRELVVWAACVFIFYSFGALAMVFLRACVRICAVHALDFGKDWMVGRLCMPNRVHVLAQNVPEPDTCVQAHAHVFSVATHA
jgi:hypothetical protein